MSKLRDSLDNLISKYEKQYQTHNRVEISKSALLHNFDLLKEVSGGLEPMPVLKSNAYGHGIEQVATALKERDFPYICVDGYYEYLQIRKVSDQPIIVMGSIALNNIPDLDFDALAFLVQDKEMIEALGKTGESIKLHLDIDTGMNRYGAHDEDLLEIFAVINEYPNLMLEGVATHFADADNPDDSFTQEQGRRFDSYVEQVREAGFDPQIIHAANSPGAPRQVSKYANAFRPGLAFYGLNPLKDEDTAGERFGNLKPALAMISTVTRVHDLHEGETVSYGRAYKADRGVRVGVIPVGYFEGLPRDLSSKAVLNSGDEDLPVLGRICMNHTMLDLSSTSVRLGDEVVVISSDPSAANSMANLCKLDNHFVYEDLVRIAEPIRRILVD